MAVLLEMPRDHGRLARVPGWLLVVLVHGDLAPTPGPTDAPDAMSFFTPAEIVSYLDDFIVGQPRAKRAVAVALRNRWRRQQLDEDLQKDVYPKNILLIGPTGCGKTEISRRLAGLVKAPFLKVEASKYSETGYHGRDVESMVRDLSEIAFRMVSQEKAREVREKAHESARDRILNALYQEHDVAEGYDDFGAEGVDGGEVQFVNDGGLWRPVFVQPTEGESPALPELGDDARRELDEVQEQREAQRVQARDELARRLDAGELDNETIMIEVRDRSTPNLSVQGPQGTETMGIDASALQELWGRGGARFRERKLRVADARRLIIDEESDALVDQEEVAEEALRRTEQEGMIFIDEIDKIVGAGGGSGPDVSREGVQRDLLTVVEGCTVYTKHGYVRTDHILFVAAGAFHQNKPSELIPELQGRFPVRVALQALTEEDFARILTEPRNSLTKQYAALLQTEGVELAFDDSGIQALAEVAFKANKTTQNIGARRLMTTLERLLEELSFDAPTHQGSKVIVDADFVTERLGVAGDDPELIQYML